MKSFLFSLVFFTLVLVGLGGCSKTPPPVNNVNVAAKVTPKEADPFRSVIDTFRYPENPRNTDDWTRFREGCQQLSGYFARPEIQERLRLSGEDRKFLENDVHLTDDEMAEVDSNVFRTADAHYLDECYLLRDAARYLETKGLSHVEQARRHFRWVMRNVYLFGKDESWTPPAFVLRRGYGSALERSLVFLALLRQSEIEGCMIVVPGDMPTQYIVGVLDPQTSSLHLFDPYLGLAVQGKDTATIATLKDVQADPRLLASSSIARDDVKKLEAWLICPMYALSPRMLELQKGLSGHDAITLYLNAPRLAADISAVSKLPVKVWNSPKKKDQTAPNSPTRELRMFLPKQEGGVDESGRTQAFRRSLMPMDQVAINYAQPGINLRPGPGFMPDRAYYSLLKFTEDLFEKYDIQVREMYLRGLSEPILRRHERLQTFVRNYGLIGIAGKESFRKELADWQNQVRQANADIVNNQAGAQKAFQSLWLSDSFINWLLNLETEKGWQPVPENPEEKRKIDVKIPVVTGILAIGTREYFDNELARSQALLNQEKAESEQAKVQASAKPTDALRERARSSWLSAQSAWSNFYVDRIVLDSLIAERLRTIKNPAFDQDPITRLGLIESLERDLHLYFEAKMRVAECTWRLDGEKAARAYLKLVQSEIERLETKNPLTPEIKKVSEKIGSLKPRTKADFQFQATLNERLDRLTSDWSERGSYYWLKRKIETQLDKPQTGDSHTNRGQTSPFP